MWFSFENHPSTGKLWFLIRMSNVQGARMTEVLVPAVHSYFAIYAIEGSAYDTPRRMSWDLHATAIDKTMAISHARMLVMQPNVHEVHVKHVIENRASGTVSVRDIKRCKRGDFLSRVRALFGF